MTPQSDDGITLARLLTKDDYRLDWSERALAIHRKVMGLFPGAHCSLARQAFEGAGYRAVGGPFG